MSQAHPIDGNLDALHLERISALADGQLREQEFTLTVELAVHDPDARAAWHAYHVVGDVLRLGETAAHRADSGFAARFAARLEREAPVERPVLSAGVADGAPAVAAAAHPVSESLDRLPTLPVRRPAANSPVFRWKMVAGLAMGIAVGAIGWNLFDTASAPGVATLAQFAGTGNQPPKLDRFVLDQPTQANGSTAGTTLLVRHASSPTMLLRDPRLDELLAAHEQSGGVSALQMPAGFLRNATFEGRSR